jgi:hypothetical protein
VKVHVQGREIVIAAEPTILERYPEYHPIELDRLIRVTSEVLLEYGETETPLPDDLLEMAPAGVARLVAADLGFADSGSDPAAVHRVVTDEVAARAMALHVIGLVRQSPELSALVEQRYDRAEQTMFVPELMMLSAALVILAMRVKRMKIGRAEVSFYAAGDEVKAFVGGLVKGVT